MEVKRAREIMIPLERFPHIPYWFTLRQALAELNRAQADRSHGRHLPWVILVFNAQYELLGLVRRREILRGLRPSLLAGKPVQAKDRLFDMKVDPNLYELSYSQDKAVQTIREQLERSVGDFMTRIDAAVQGDDSILSAIDQMIEKNLSFIPVLDEGRVVGVVYALDALQAITELVF